LFNTNHVKIAKALRSYSVPLEQITSLNLVVMHLTQLTKPLRCLCNKGWTISWESTSCSAYKD